MIYTMNDELAAQIMTNMMDNSDPSIDVREGTPTYTAFAPIADELANLYAELTAQEESNFIVNEAGEITMFGFKLDLFAQGFGETRKPGGRATGGVFLYADEPTLVPAGTQVFAPATINVLFATDTDITATPEGASVPITAVFEGADGNVSAGAITGVVGDLTDVLTVTNPTETIDGFDEEGDEEFAARIINNRQNPAGSGNAAHYKQWATEVIGIKDAYVIPVWNGENTVKVILLSSDNNAPSADKVQEVSDYITTQAPESATVTVEPATEVPINITATIQQSADTADVTSEFTALVTEYLQTLKFGESDTVRIVRLQDRLLDIAGVIDITEFTVNGGTANIVIPAGNVAVTGTVTINVQP